jgi:hypothetical protein
VIRISDQTRSSVQRLIASLEKQAETYGKSGVDRLITQRDQLLQRYNREPQAIDAITRSYEKMIAMEEKAAREALAVKAAKEAEEALRKQSEAITSFGDRVSQFMENPLQGAKGALSSVLSTLGPFGIAVTAGAAVLGTIAASAFEAAKSLGEYGTRVKDAELRTGLTAKEVGQFGFAARAVGQDISIVERLMRGLSQAADDNSREGEKARATLRGMGIDLHTATGEMKPTSEILTEISEGLNKLPEGLQRDAAAMDLFKKVGVEAIPFMTELNENLRVAHEQGFGPTEEDIRRFAEYQREVTVLETKWDALVRKFKEGLVVTVTWVGKGVDWFLNNISTAGDDERQRREEEQAMQDAADIRAAGGIGAKMSISGHRQQVADMERQAPEIMKNRDATLEAHRGFAGPTARAGRRFRHPASDCAHPRRGGPSEARKRNPGPDPAVAEDAGRMPRQPPSGQTCVQARKKRIAFAPGSSARTMAWRRLTPTPRRMSSGSRSNCSNRTSR